MGNSAHIEWLSFSLKERNLLLQEQHLALVTEAVSTIKNIDKYCGVCKVCIAQALGYDKVVRNRKQIAVGNKWSYWKRVVCAFKTE